jgi:hypothetical protein
VKYKNTTLIEKKPTPVKYRITTLKTTLTGVVLSINVINLHFNGVILFLKNVISLFHWCCFEGRNSIFYWCWFFSFKVVFLYFTGVVLSQECNFIFSHFDRQNNTSEIIQLHS